jgi:hypothetical protein
MRPLQSRAWTRRGEEEKEEEKEEDDDGVVDLPLCKLPPSAAIYRRRRSRRIPSFFHLERIRIGEASALGGREKGNLGRNGGSEGECVELETEVFFVV